VDIRHNYVYKAECAYNSNVSLYKRFLSPLQITNDLIFLQTHTSFTKTCSQVMVIKDLWDCDKQNAFSSTHCRQIPKYQNKCRYMVQVLHICL